MLYDVMLCGCPMCSVKRGRMMRFDIIIISERRKGKNTSIDLDATTTTTTTTYTNSCRTVWNERTREGDRYWKDFRKEATHFVYGCLLCLFVCSMSFSFCFCLSLLLAGRVKVITMIDRYGSFENLKFF